MDMGCQGSDGRQDLHSRMQGLAFRCQKFLNIAIGYGSDAKTIWDLLRYSEADVIQLLKRITKQGDRRSVGAIMGKLVRNDFSYHYGSTEDPCVNYFALAPTSWKV